MLLTALVFLAALMFLVRGLRHPAYVLHAASVMAALHLLYPAAPPMQWSQAVLVPVVLMHLALINLWEVILYWYDKRAAQSTRRRIPERTLHGLALVGATPAAYLASKWFRHKTKKQSFRAMFWLIFLLQIVALIAFFVFSDVASQQLMQLFR